MHEYHLAKSVLKSILEKVKDIGDIKRVSAVKLKIGELKMVTADTFKETFSEIAHNTLCDNALLDIDIVKGDTVVVEDIEAEFNEEN
ncbi:MAG: hydrogenase maturation nickel metallochaperone HypA [Candidatus Omnitrophota bacterium]